MDNYLVNNVALKTLKQRCEYLQHKLNVAEEENCRLKLEKARDLNCQTPREFSTLEERIILLNEEKSQMARQIQLIANENFTLWSILAKVAPEKNISNLRFSVSAVPANQMVQLNQYDSNSNDYSKETFEELSLQLINGIIMGKNELENQYSQMMELQKENIVEDNSSFVLKQIDCKAAMKSLKEYIQKLKDFKQDLCKQKYELSNAITLVKNWPILSRQKDISNLDLSFSRESNINMNQPNSELSTYQDFPALSNGYEKLDSGPMICPMCGKSFSELFITFFQHVSEHFDDENDDFVDARANFDGA